MPIRRLGLGLGLGVCLVGAVASLQGQSGAPPAPTSQQDNPFPGEPQKATQKAGTQQAAKPGPDSKSPQKQDAIPDKPKVESDNPFPGEDSNAPIIPVDPGPGANSGYPQGRRGTDSGTDSAGSPSSAGADSGPEGDPVRSPDAPGTGGNDGFSSSRTGFNGIPAEDDTDAVPGQSAKHKTREEKLREDLDTGGFYAEKKNWKAAQSRFADAFALDKENADAVWGLAEAERHLQMYKEAGEHYELFLSYDPDGPHSRAARKALEQILAQRGQSSLDPARQSASPSLQPK